ncbi:hypothetical protein FACS1894116_10430 [Betaproteobacteria bacterium]|nr:hypothetical protein FACS1894116_10430 [Betaproteobacteria bacterium]GHU27431.1 hypothetical protein FACS189497_00620 [Betaproteobacteria bacterium]
MAKLIKCLVWDLDNTLWQGVLLEGEGNSLLPGVRETIIELDKRGILHSIASRNVREEALARLESFGLAEYFLYPQIDFGAKSQSVAVIAKALNLSVDSFAFIDDQPFERDEVQSSLPEVRVYPAEEVARLPELTEFTPRFVNQDSAQRRAMYKADISRKMEEEEFSGPQEAFLQGLQMRFQIAPVAAGDLERAVDLTERTNQLNATALTFDHDELDALSKSPQHLLHISSLEDKYGSYGRIGLSLVEKGEKYWTIKLLLMSCRVMNRGVGSIQLNYLIREALRAGKKLRADFVETTRNRMMYVTYKFAGFEEIASDGPRITLEYKGQDNMPPSFPDYLEIAIP